MSIVDALLDSSIFFSFDRSGFRRHAAHFDASDLDVDLTGRTVVVTGANAGLGKATAAALAGRGAMVHLLCRNRARGEAAVEELRGELKNPQLRLWIVDISLMASIRSFIEVFDVPSVDVLVNNAGVLADRRTITPEGFELTWATNVLGPFLLTHLLSPKLSATQESRVITVSSGGMYTQRLDLSDVTWSRRPFDGVVAYAQTKRAEVILNELWARELRGRGIVAHAMHPGWADTPGVERTLPRFHRLTKGRLRTPAEGADTIVWLAVAKAPLETSGGFWFDRRPAKTHLLPFTKETAADRAELWRSCCDAH